MTDNLQPPSEKPPEVPSEPPEVPAVAEQPVRPPEQTAEPRPATGPAPARPARRVLRPPSFGGLIDGVFLALLAAVLMVPGINTLAAVMPGEAAALSLTRALLADGDLQAWLWPGGTGAATPPLAIWMQGLAATISGLGAAAPDWVLRLPSLFAVVLSALFVSASGRAIAGRRAGFVAGLLFAPVAMAGLAARLALPDAIELAALSAAGWALLSSASDAEAEGRAIRTLTFWTAIAAGLLAGSWVLPVAVAAMLATLVVVDWSAARVAALNWRLGPLVLVLLLAPAVIGLVLQALASGIPELGVALDWFVPDDPGRSLPPGTHTALAMLAFWPLSAFVVMVLAAPRARAKDPSRRRAAWLLAAWILPAWFLVEALPEKRLFDPLPLLPPLAIMAGLALGQGPVPAVRFSARIGFGLLAAGSAAYAFALNAGAVFADGHASLIGIAVGAIAIIAGFAAAWFLLRERFVPGLAATIVSAAAVAALAFVVLRSATEAALAF